MILKLWKNFSKRKNSTKIPDRDANYTMEVVLKASTSIKSPTFIIKGIDFEVNYCLFNNHYYFIDDIIVDSNEVYNLVCSQDVLATYRDDIALSTQFVERSASHYDVNVSDNLVSNTSNIIKTGHTTTGIGLSTTGIYLLRIAGAKGISNYICSAGGVGGINRLLSNMFNSDLYGFTEEATKFLFNPFQYIVSVSWLPVSVRQVTSVSVDSVKFGWFSAETSDFNLCSNEPVYESRGTILIPTNEYNDFRKYDDNFTNLNIYLPGVGSVTLSSSQVADGLKYCLTLDLITGNCIYVLTHNDGSVISTLSGQLGVSVQIGQMNSVLGSVISGVTNAVTNSSNPVSNLIDTARGIMQPTQSINGSTGNVSTIKEYPFIVVSLENFGSKDIPTIVAGRPYLQSVLLGKLRGYCKCGNPSLDIDGLGNDKEAVNNYLASGFYIE